MFLRTWVYICMQYYKRFVFCIFLIIINKATMETKLCDFFPKLNTYQLDVQGCIEFYFVVFRYFIVLTFCF